MVRIFVLAVMAGAALWGEGWTVVKGSEGIQWPYDAVQTPDGALWVAAGTQVYRYDGRQVQVYGESQGLGSKRGMVLAVDGSGALLAGTTEGLFRMEGGRFRRLMEGDVFGVAGRGDGLIALNVAGVVMAGRVDGPWRRLEMKEKSSGQVVFEPSGGMLFGCADGLCEVSGERMKKWETLTGTDVKRSVLVLAGVKTGGLGIPIMGVGRDRWGRVWAAGLQRLFVAERVEGPFQEVKGGAWMHGGRPMIRLSRGGVAYFGGLGGVGYGDRNGQVVTIPADTGGNAYAGTMAYWDGQGLLWAGKAGGGLMRREMTAPVYQVWGAEAGLDSTVYGIHEMKDGRMLAGTLRGIYALSNDGARWAPMAGTLERFGGSLAMGNLRDGAVLFGVNRGPPVLARMEKDGSVRKTWVVPPVTDGPNVYSMIPEPKGGWWIGSARRLYRVEEKGAEVEVTPVPLPVRDLGNNFFQMTLDESGRVLAPGNWGLLRVDGAKVERWGKADGLLQDAVRFIARDGKGWYWVGYAGKPGVSAVRFDGGRITVRHGVAGAGIGEVEDLLADRRGWIWVTDSLGVWVNRTGELDGFERVGQTVEVIAKGANTASLYEDAAGGIWASGASGTMRIAEPALFVEERPGPAPVTLSGWAFSGQEGTPLRAQLHSPWLRGMEAVQFRWRLGGGAWQVSEDGAVRVEAVPVGELAFEAQAEHRNGNWKSAVVRVPVVSVLPWWRVTWVWWAVGVAVLGVGGFFGVRRKRAREEAEAYAAAKLAFLERQRGLPVFGGRYQGLAVIGTGAFATVYRAADELDGKEVAVKALVSAAAVRKELDREVESLRRISHPGVVGILDYSIGEDGGAYLVLDYVPGPTLREVLEIGAMERGRVAVLARQLGEALGAAHAAGVIHRDLKPENIILRPEGEDERAVIVDFGIAVCKPPGATSARATSVGGTLFYLAPEQMGGAARPTADIYSFAVILCEALTGVCPEIVEEQGLERRAEAAGRLLAGDPVAELICEAMAYEAGLRPKDALAFGLAVERVLLG